MSHDATAAAQPSPSRISDAVLTISPGTTYYLPDTGGLLPHSYSPFAPQAVPAAKARVRGMLTACVGQPLADKILDQDGIAEWACYVYPLGNRQRTEVLIDAGLCALVCDDEFTLTGLSTDLPRIRERVSLYTRVLEGEPPPAQAPSAVWLAQSMDGIAELATPEFITRFKRICADINDLVPVEAEHRLTRVLPPWEEYVAFRRVNLYGFWAVAACEFSVGIDMTAYLDGYRVFRELELAAVEHIMFTNDLYSFPKEAQGGEVANTFWVLRRDGKSVQEAVTFLAAELIERQHRFQQLREEIASSALGDRDDVRSYLRAVSYCLGGNLQYHRTTGRYHGSGYTGPPVNAGTITIGERGTVFVPDSTEEVGGDHGEDAISFG
ncbi:terpene synthase family protein [Saccharomonospora sp. NPDC046836]|uniref:terpene synthase family protein n=1 Tax=Saccharomonospora sp. NPDC046836 TaxID=3156921 RepID=UPI0033E0DDE8